MDNHVRSVDEKYERITQFDVTIYVRYIKRHSATHVNWQEYLLNEELDTLWKESRAAKFEMLYRLLNGGSEEKYEPSVPLVSILSPGMPRSTFLFRGTQNVIIPNGVSYETFQ